MEEVLSRPRIRRTGAPALRRASTILLLTATVLSATGCQTPSEGSRTSTERSGCISDFNEGTDYFPDKVSLTDAKGFSVEYHGSYKVVTVAQAVQGGGAERYVLIRCGAPEPRLTGELATARKITIPVRRVASASTTQLPAFELLDRVDSIVAVSTPDLVNTPSVTKKIKDGSVTGFGTSGGEVNVERVVAARPDLYLAGGMDTAAAKKVAAAGIPVVADSAWLEETPLGRAEWVKYFSLFLDREKEASDAYATIAAAYRDVEHLAAKATSRPTSIAGRQYKGTWYVPAGHSYVAALLRDAGSDYVFADVPGTGSVTVDMETVLAKGSSARYWLNAEMTAGWRTTADAVAEDPRYARLTALRAQAVWSPVRRVNAAGGNDYWESGVVRPDLVLKDLAAIFHPDLLPGHQHYYYVKLGS
jgi:iron complex transport system substrate-binding protein